MTKTRNASPDLLVSAASVRAQAEQRDVEQRRLEVIVMTKRPFLH